MEVPFHKKVGYLVPMDKNNKNNKKKKYIYIYIHTQKGKKERNKKRFFFLFQNGKFRVYLVNVFSLYFLFPKIIFYFLD